MCSLYELGHLSRFETFAPPFAKRRALKSPEGDDRLIRNMSTDNFEMIFSRPSNTDYNLTTTTKISTVLTYFLKFHLI